MDLCVLVLVLACGRIGFDSQILSIVETEINNGDTSTSVLPLAVRVVVRGGASPVEVRLAEANLYTGACDPSGDEWRESVGPPQTYLFRPAPVNLPKKICVWARDATGATTVMASPLGSAGVDTDSIAYTAGSPPKVTSLSVTNAQPGPRLGTQSYVAGDQVNIAWSIVDQAHQHA